MKYCAGLLTTSLILLGLFQTELLHAETPKKSKTRYFRHEVNVSIGITSVRSGWSDDYENDVMSRFGLVVGKGGADGVIYESMGGPDLRRDNPLKAISYYYHFDHHFAFGGLFGFCNVEDWLGYPAEYRSEKIQKKGYTYVKGTSIFVMPSVKWSYLNSRWCSLYMKTSLGLHFQSLHLDSETIQSEQTDEFDKNHLSLAYNITPLGWEIGKQQLRWFMEISVGSNTNFQTGLILRFASY